MKILLSVKFVPGTKHRAIGPSLYPKCQPRSRTRRLGLRSVTYYYVLLLRSQLRCVLRVAYTLPFHLLFPSPSHIPSLPLYHLFAFPLYYILLLHPLPNPSLILFALPSLPLFYPLYYIVYLYVPLLNPSPYTL